MSMELPNQEVIIKVRIHMKKFTPILLFILSPTFAHAMETNFSSLISSATNYCSSFFSISSSCKDVKTEESSLILDLRKKKKEFGNILKDEYIESRPKFAITPTLYIATNRVDADPTQFLNYCYYQKFHNNVDDLVMMDNIVDEFNSNPSLLQKCQTARINGYSALGAAMLAPDISAKKKRAFNQTLANYGVKPTPEDVALAELLLYDALIDKRKREAFICLVHLQKKWNIPADIKKIIDCYMIQLFKRKKRYWLLPGFIHSDYLVS